MHCLWAGLAFRGPGPLPDRIVTSPNGENRTIMNADKRKRIATLELSAGCLQEAAERLHRLCPLLHNLDHENECTEAARNISSQVAVIQNAVAELRTEA